MRRLPRVRFSFDVFCTPWSRHVSRVPVNNYCGNDFFFFFSLIKQTSSKRARLNKTSKRIHRTLRPCKPHRIIYRYYFDSLNPKDVSMPMNFYQKLTVKLVFIFIFFFLFSTCYKKNKHHSYDRQISKNYVVAISIYILNYLVTYIIQTSH